jgi:hypothetical protein
MKFDVIVGNPPYQNRGENSDGSLWLKFVNLGMQNLAPDGTLAYVTPTSWVGKVTKSSKADWSPFTSNHVAFYRPLSASDKKKHFGDIGSTFGYYLLRHGSGLTLLELEDGSRVQHQLIAGDPLPSQLDRISYRIHQKIAAQPRFNMIADFSFHSQKLKKLDAVRDSLDHRYRYKTYYSHNLIRYSDQKQSIHQNIKVMVPIVGTLSDAWYDQDCNITEDVRYLPADSVSAAENLVALFNSGIYTYINRQYRPGRNLGIMLSFLPKFDAAKRWSDGEIHAAIGLDQEEIAYIQGFSR